MKALNHKKGTFEITLEERNAIALMADRNIQLLSMTNALTNFLRHKDMIEEFDAWTQSENDRIDAEQQQKALDSHIEALPDAKPKKARKTKELVN